ncbi:MAG TPA: dihydroorotase [Acidiphilium sp.]|jgi:dihydroorotase|uniref:dihydroorotase n=1 Tax=unclassified Acidiphilium TaxID=2617493 RepID=UPI000BDC78E7|nr:MULTISPECIES: dihydroorotase [unclassified Acidiphilium]OYV55589.1 MAG: dihydroorotase [Acidiphilium sp. 20-67-58]HQT60176.1 dihydroorotase [Acidiphilium sp.]HQU10546.1 dihydroorotase [Acidiphilium sp.]
MTERYDLIIENGTLILPWGEATGRIGVRDGRIATLAATGDAAETIDARGLHVLPGLIDPHVHFRDSGSGELPAVETMETGTRGAVLGGITAIFDMPNTGTPATGQAALAAKRDSLAGRAWCDVGLYVGATKDNIGDLAALEAEPGICAIKVFAGSSTGNLLVEDDASIERVMRAGRRRIAFHSEDEFRLQARRGEFSTGMAYANHAVWRDPECAALGTRRIMALARRTFRPAHILHVSTEEEFAYLRDFRDIASVEVLVNHLTQMAPDAYDRLGAYAVMNPPIRDRRHVEAAWRAVADGLVDTIGSDHAPHPRAAKERPWPETAAGLTGVQTLVPVMLDQVAQGRLTLTRLVDLMAAGPARIYGAVGKGRIAAGYDADFTLVDLRRQQRIEAGWLASPCGWSPFEGERVTGWPVMTIIRGQVAMRDGAVTGSPAGRIVAFRS